MADTVAPMITDDAEPAPAPMTRCVAERAYTLAREGGRISLAFDELEGRAAWHVEITDVELDVPLGTRGGVVVPLDLCRSFDLDGPGQARELASWIRATTGTCEEVEARDGSDDTPAGGIVGFAVDSDHGRVSLDYDRHTGRLECRVTTDKLPVTLPAPSPWSPCKLALTVQLRVPLPRGTICDLAAWIDQTIPSPPADAEPTDSD